MADVQGLIDRFYEQIYVWKCFGDGLAFSYVDKFAVKHALFEIDSQQIKQGAGMLSGKSGTRERDTPFGVRLSSTMFQLF